MSQHSPLQKALAWATHAFTASGMIAGFFAILYIRDHQFIEAIYCLMLAFFIDGVDGSLARAFKVGEVLPKVDGKMIDYVVDFANYALIPAFFIYEAGTEIDGQYVYMLPEAWRWVAISSILLVSGLYYGLDGMVSTDMFFVGFPVLWNVVAFYLHFVFDWLPWVNFGVIIFCAIAHFLPLKFVYPSRSIRFKIPNLAAMFFAAFANIWLLISLQQGKDIFWMRVLSISIAVYFCLLTIYNSFFETAFKTPDSTA